MRIGKIKPELATAEDLARLRQEVVALAEHVDTEMAGLRQLVGQGFASTSGQTGEQNIVDGVAAALLQTAEEDLR